MGPRPERGGPTLIVGGTVDASLDRAARHGDGWALGGGRPEVFSELAGKLDAAWERHGREGKPRKMTLAYFALGPNAAEDAERGLGEYYAWLGDELAGMIVDSAANDADTVREYIEGFEAAGCDEIFFFPSSSDPAQVGVLAEAAGL